MKIKTKNLDFDKVSKLKKPEHQKPLKPNFLLSSLIRLLSVFDLHATKFTFTEKRMEEIKDKPCLILMNHSCFLDLEIAFRIFYPRRMGVVCTSDGFVGKKTLMRMTQVFLCILKQAIRLMVPQQLCQENLECF